MALVTSLALWSYACSGDPKPGGAEDLPHGIRHVIVISVDTLRASHLGCYGHDFIQSPSVDGLASDGVRFTHCTSAAPTTLPSHTSLFTGKHPHSHGVSRNGYEVPDANTMLAEVLGKYGFTTAGFVGAAPLGLDVNFHQGFTTYDAEFTQTEGMRETIFQRPADEVSKAALDWLDNNEVTASDRLFLFLHYFDVHAPYTFPEPIAGMYAAEAGGETGQAIDTSMGALKAVRVGLRREQRQSAAQGARGNGFQATMEASGSEAVKAAQLMAAEYAAGVTYTDQKIGALLSALDQRGILEESLLVFISDHGETLYEHSNVFNHGNSVYESETHVPLIMRFPGKRYAGLEVTAPVSNTDVMPTVLNLLELRAPDDVTGVDLTPALAGQGIDRGPVFSEATRPYDKVNVDAAPVWANQGKYQSVTVGRYKYVQRTSDEKFHLFDLESDPDEQRNLLRGGDEAIMAKRDELELLLRAWRQEAAPLDATRSDSASLDKALEALGYGGADQDE